MICKCYPRPLTAFLTPSLTLLYFQEPHYICDHIGLFVHRGKRVICFYVIAHVCVYITASLYLHSPLSLSIHPSIHLLCPRSRVWAAAATCTAPLHPAETSGGKPPDPKCFSWATRGLPALWATLRSARPNSWLDFDVVKKINRKNRRKKIKSGQQKQQRSLQRPRSPTCGSSKKRQPRLVWSRTARTGRNTEAVLQKSTIEEEEEKKNRCGNVKNSWFPLRLSVSGCWDRSWLGAWLWKHHQRQHQRCKASLPLRVFKLKARFVEFVVSLSIKQKDTWMFSFTSQYHYCYTVLFVSYSYFLWQHWHWQSLCIIFKGHVITWLLLRLA